MAMKKSWQSSNELTKFLFFMGQTRMFTLIILAKFKQVREELLDTENAEDTARKSSEQKKRFINRVVCVVRVLMLRFFWHSLGRRVSIGKSISQSLLALPFGNGSRWKR